MLSCNLTRKGAKMGKNRNVPRPVHCTYQCSLGPSFQNGGDRNLGMWKYVPAMLGPEGS